MKSRLRVLRYALLGRVGFDPPQPPQSLAGGIGLGPFWRTGRWTVDQISRTVDLSRTQSVVEVGSGLGRLAWPLSLRLPRDASYVGLEVSKPYIDWARRVVPLSPSRFRFVHVDHYNSHYNPAGVVPEEEVVYPVESSTVDLVIANSLFTHLLPMAIARSLSECLRILRPGGALFATFFLLDDDSRAAMRAGRTHPTLRHGIRHGAIEDLENPAFAVGVDRSWLAEQVEQCGLKLCHVDEGGWRSAVPGRRFQDSVLACKLG